MWNTWWCTRWKGRRPRSQTRLRCVKTLARTYRERRTRCRGWRDGRSWSRLYGWGNDDDQMVCMWRIRSVDQARLTWWQDTTRWIKESREKKYIKIERLLITCHHNHPSGLSELREMRRIESPTQTTFDSTLVFSSFSFSWKIHLQRDSGMNGERKWRVKNWKGGEVMQSFPKWKAAERRENRWCNFKPFRPFSRGM